MTHDEEPDDDIGPDDAAAPGSEGRAASQPLVLARADALSCSFCGKGQNEVQRLIAGPAVYICSECVALSVEILEDDAQVPDPVAADLPRVAAELDAKVVGQLAAKRALTAAWIERALSDAPDGLSSRAARLLFVGPTGAGKTTLATAFCGICDGRVADVGRLSESGYAGQDVEWILHGILEMEERRVGAERRVVVLDGLEKLKAERPASGGRDVSGEGAQRELLAFLEGAVLHLPSRSGRFHDTTRPLVFDSSCVVVVALFRSEGAPPEDTTDGGLRDYLRSRGIIGPFLARFDRVLWMAPPSEDEAHEMLVREGGLLARVRRLVERAGRKLEIDPEAVRLAARAAAASDCGGWRLRQLLEQVIEDALLASTDTPTRITVDSMNALVRGRHDAPL